jgi:SAM-dependent methyltransferase
MQTLENLAKFWSDEGLKHIIPNVGNEFPEGFDVRGLIKRVIDPTGGILEVGCGYGRLCQAFSSSEYLGVDVNPAAIAVAREKNPGYRFEHIAPGAELPGMGTALIYTVALHIPDEELERFMKPICTAAPVLMIAEIMDSRWRHPGDPPVFNRDPEQYIMALMRLGFFLRSWGKIPYARYNNTSGNIADSRITFHIYTRSSPN